MSDHPEESVTMVSTKVIYLFIYMDEIKGVLTNLSLVMLLPVHDLFIYFTSII